MYLERLSRELKSGDSEESREIVEVLKPCFENSYQDKLIYSNIVITKDNIYEDFLSDSFHDFALQHLKKIISWNPEVILVGSGKSINFPNKEWVDYANRKNIKMRPAWILLHKVNYLKKFQRDKMQISEKLYNSLISIPSSV